MCEDLIETNKEIAAIEVNDAIEVKAGVNCEPGKVCEAKDFFEMITECALCGKLC
jgi:hypothetical protein